MSSSIPRDLIEKGRIPVKLYAFADETHPQLEPQIAAMLRNDLQGLEIRTVDETNVTDMTVSRVVEIRKRLEDSGLCVWSVGSPMGKTDLISDDFAHETDRLKHTVELARAMKSENIRMFSFYLPAQAKSADFKNQVVERLGVWAEIAADAGVRLCLENEKGLFGENPDACLEIYQAIPAICGVFDPANFVQAGYDPLQAWEKLKDRTYYLHIKDALYGGDVVPPGFGDGHIREIVQSFRANGGENATMEPHLYDFGAYKSLEKEGLAVELGKRFAFASSDEAFDAAVHAFRKLL